MSLLTRCPACTTLYKVVPDQLRISQGWVKCGQCGEIFDATQHLIEAFTDAQEAIGDTSTETVLRSQDVSDDGLQQPIERDVAAVQTQHELPETETALEVQAVPDSGEIAAHDEDALVSHEGSASDALESAPLSVPPMAVEQAPALSPADGPAHQPEPEPDVGATSQDTALPLSFMRDAGQASAWHRRWRPLVLVVISVVLLLGLGGQWIYQDHDRLAAARPQWRPALEGICATLHCSVTPLQQIESIAIDSAAFSKGSSGRYRLSFTLRNTAHLMLALPSIELTLTDDQDRAVVRKVIGPQEFAAGTALLGANAEWPVMVNLRIQTETSLPAVVGYRLLAFYP